VRAVGLVSVHVEVGSDGTIHVEVGSGLHYRLSLESVDGSELSTLG
jgi:hypothetical protein